jgi:hypothetical protein
MKNKQLITERRQIMKIAGLLNEDDYSMGTPSGDTDAMGDLAEFSSSHPYIKSLDDAIKIVSDVNNFVSIYAGDDESGKASEADKLSAKLEDLKNFLENMRKNGE